MADSSQDEMKQFATLERDSRVLDISRLMPTEEDNESGNTRAEIATMRARDESLHICGLDASFMPQEIQMRTDKRLLLAFSTSRILLSFRVASHYVA